MLIYRLFHELEQNYYFMTNCLYVRRFLSSASISICTSSLFESSNSINKGRRQKKWTFGWLGPLLEGSRPEYTFRPKKYHFLFLLPSDAEAFKTCKNTIKHINLCALPTLSGTVEYMTLADSDCVL